MPGKTYWHWHWHWQLPAVLGRNLDLDFQDQIASGNYVHWSLGVLGRLMLVHPFFSCSCYHAVKFSALADSRRFSGSCCLFMYSSQLLCAGPSALPDCQRRARASKPESRRVDESHYATGSWNQQRPAKAGKGREKPPRQREPLGEHGATTIHRGEAARSRRSQQEPPEQEPEVVRSREGSTGLGRSRQKSAGFRRSQQEPARAA